MLRRNLTFLVLACTSLCACSHTEQNASAPPKAIAHSSPSSASVQNTVAAATSSQAQAPKKSYGGPFGLAMGISLSEAKQLLPSLSENSDGTFTATTVPTPHEAFESYILVFSSKSGLCKIVAIGKDIQSGDNGFEVQSAFDDLSQGLSKKYGHGKKYDRVTGSMDEPQFWMMTLSEKNRMLAEIWDAEDGATLPKELSGIALEAHASNLRTGFINLSYQFANFNDCIEENKEKDNKGL